MLAALYTACITEPLEEDSTDGASPVDQADSFSTDAAAALQLLFAGAVAPDAVSVRLSAPALRCHGPYLP